MELKHVALIAKEISAPENFVKATVELLEEGGTVPFIARYRKEQTGSLDEVQIITIRDRYEQLGELDKRRTAILKSITEQNKLTPELEKKINAALTMTVLEDLYLPYKQKRKTKGVMAKEKGLEPLSVLMLAQGKEDPIQAASAFVNAELGVKDETEALNGARDIVEEIINEDAELRASLRKIFEQTAMVVSAVGKGKEQEGEKYRDYFEWSEKLSSVPSHRLLAMRRGEKEMVLSLDVVPDEEQAIGSIETKYITSSGPWKELMQQASKGAFKRLLKPSLETEFRLSSKGKADEEAIRVFVDNVRQLLLSSPLGQKNILALDPGFRSGCKMVALNRQGKLIDNTNIYPHEPQRQTAQSGAAIMAWCEKYEIEAIAIGNGTA
ncbi:MAG: RNA-binding transcriptional accessory protein, partial [Cytophagaceae bacterium]|nr:RNA-binding transcriptional accessory protein [Cytophagaceae bacterium]